jgi:hypothetical protein
VVENLRILVFALAVLSLAILVYTMDADAAPPQISSPSPSNLSTDVATSPTCSVHVRDAEPMTVDWLEWNGTAWVLRQRDSGVSTGSATWMFLMASDYETTYYWRVNVTDGVENATEWYQFTTGEAPEGTTRNEWNIVLDDSLTWGLAMIFVVVILWVVSVGMNSMRGEVR